MTDQRTVDSVSWANRLAAEDTIGPDLTEEQIEASGVAVTARWSEKHPKARLVEKEDWIAVSYRFPPLLKARLEHVAKATKLPERHIVTQLLGKALAEESLVQPAIDWLSEADRLSAKAWAAGTLARWRQKMEDARAAMSGKKLEVIVTRNMYTPVKPKTEE
jgi:predicted alpha/beta hydrolase family esterase